MSMNVEQPSEIERAEWEALPKKSRSSDPVTWYAQQVVAEKLIAGPYVRDACKRHLLDLVHGHERGLMFDVKRAKKDIEFFPDVLRLAGGAYEGKSFELLGWQQFVVGSIFGWLGPDGYRRFRMAYIETAKGSGKSPLAAGIGMKGLVADGEPRAEIYAAGAKKDQAMILFRDAVAMRTFSPELNLRLRPSGSGENVWNLAYLEKGSFFRPIAADDNTQSGPRPHMNLVDEIHEHKTSTLIDMLIAGMKSRRQGLTVGITNSGASKTGPAWEYHEYAIKICSGVLHDDSFFGYVCAIDKGEDPINDEACWPKVNPSLQEANLPGVRYLRDQVTKARGMPAAEALIRRINFCQWTDAENPWLSADVWTGARRTIDWRTLKGCVAYGAMDLGSTTDLTAAVFLVDLPWGGHLLVPFFWMPDNDIEERSKRDGVPYRAWIDAGYITATPGRAVSRLLVAQKFSRLAEHFDHRVAAFDRWRIEDLKQAAEDEGIELPALQPFGQGFQSMAPAVNYFEEKLLAGELVHDGNPVLTWCMSNVVVTTDDAENQKLSKAKSSGRIDGAVASVMAVGLRFSERKDELKDHDQCCVSL